MAKLTAHPPAYETVSQTATVESAKINTEQNQFLRYENIRRVMSPMFDHTNGAADGFAVRLSGATNERYGLAKSLSVMLGDVINTEVYAKYVSGSAGNTQALNDFIAAIVNAASPAGTVIDGAGYASSTSSFAFAGLVPKTDNATAPKAYPNWIVFDRNYNVKDFGYTRVSTSAQETGTDGPHERLAKANVLIKETGYVYFYLSSENDGNYLGGDAVWYVVQHAAIAIASAQRAAYRYAAR